MKRRQVTDHSGFAVTNQAVALLPANGGIPLSRKLKCRQAFCLKRTPYYYHGAETDAEKTVWRKPVMHNRQVDLPQPCDV
jgi:hypothetical protein